MSKQPEALRLAQHLEIDGPAPQWLACKAATELRRLHAAEARLLDALEEARDSVFVQVQSLREAYRGYPHRYAAEEATLAKVDAAIAAAKGEA